MYQTWRNYFLVFQKRSEFLKDVIMIRTERFVIDKFLSVLKFFNNGFKLVSILRIEKIRRFKKESLLFIQNFSFAVMRDCFQERNTLSIEFLNKVCFCNKEKLLIRLQWIFAIFVFVQNMQVVSFIKVNFMFISIHYVYIFLTGSFLTFFIRILNNSKIDQTKL